MTHRIVFVATPEQLDAFLISILSNNPRKVALDLEGIDLCRNGCISILQIIAEGSGTIWLIDVTTLGRTVFEHQDADGRSLRKILESRDIIKILYDVRCDADALYNLFQVDMKNTYDLQLLEVAARRASKLRVKFICGLGKTIEQYLAPPAEWKRIKEEGASLFAPEKGGTYEVFERRPLDPRILLYCAQDVSLLFDLEAVLESRIRASPEGWHDRVVLASSQRVNESHSRFFSGKGPHRAIAPIF